MTGTEPEAVTGGLGRFSLNQATTKRWPLDETVAGLRQAAGVSQLGLWRDQVDRSASNAPPPWSATPACA